MRAMSAVQRASATRRPRARQTRALLSGALLAALAACDSGQGAGAAGAQGGAGGGALACEAPRGECYRDGWRVEGERLWVEVESAAPSAPSRGLNTWTVRVGRAGDAAGGAAEGLEGCSLSAAPFMPDHMHGSNTAAGEELGGGRYSLVGFDLIMPGYWELPVRASCPDASGALEETLTFGFWLEG